ncbi:hypothetical protein K9U39_03265 [Rhodoblastus acidophilus]|nr:hypothetical protein [Rhodoblastus acidophilus]
MTRPEVEAMHLADDRIAGDAVSQFVGDLAGAQTVKPHFLQLLDAFIGPGHRVASKTLFVSCPCTERRWASYPFGSDLSRAPS